MACGDDYYKQKDLFGREPDPYQKQVLADILDLLPEDIESVLDVGCGDGFITNALPERLRVVGLDISEEALRHVKRPTKTGSITEIPFPDKSFDLVMANDILEHLPDAEYRKALDELARVAAKYVLVTVPHREQLEAQQAKCADCGCVYHLNRHQRAYDQRDLCDLFASTIRPVEIRYSGDLTLSPPDPTIAIKHGQGFYQTWRKGVCPDCGSGEQVTHDSDCVFLRVLNAVCCTVWSRALRDQPRRNNRTEIMALYARDPASRMPRRRQYEEKTGSPFSIEFDNKSQSVGRGFTLGAPWAQFYLPPGAVITKEGVRRAPGAAKAIWVPIRIPVEAKANDTICIYASGARRSDVLAVNCTDGINRLDRKLFGEAIRAKGRCVKIHLPERLWPDQYGTIVGLHITGGVQVHRLCYEPASYSAPETVFVQLEPGHNVLYADGADPVISWGITVDSRGYYPKPDFLESPDVHKNATGDAE